MFYFLSAKAPALTFLVYCVLAKGKCQCFALKETDNTDRNMEHSSYVYNTTLSNISQNLLNLALIYV